jgi:CRP-like cAMP-binding protein
MSVSRDDLRRVPIFAGLDDGALEWIAARVTVAEVAAGHVLMEVGQPGNGLFLVQQGKAVAELPDGREVEHGPGSFFGELALLTDRPRAARVRVVADSTLLALSRRDFQELIESESGLALAMLRSLANRMADES